MQVPRSLREDLERAILTDIADVMECWDWNIRCFVLGNKALVLVVGMHSQLDKTFSKQYAYDVDPDRKLRDRQNQPYLKGATMAKKKGSTKAVGYFKGQQGYATKSKQSKASAKPSMKKRPGGRRR